MPLLGINCLDSFLNFRNRKKPKSSKQKIPAFFIWTKLSLFLLSISHSSRFPFLLTPIPPLLPILHFPLLQRIPFSPTSLFLYSNTPHFSFPLLQLTPLPLIFYFPFLRYLHFFPFSTFLCPTSSHFLPRPFFSIPIHPIFPFSTPTHPTPPYFLLPFSPTPLTSSHPSLSFAPTHPIFSHAPFSLFQYAPFLHIPFSYIPTPPPFPIPSHVFFSSKSNHTRSPKNTSSPKSKTRKSPCPFPMQHALRRTIIFFSPTKK